MAIRHELDKLTPTPPGIFFNRRSFIKTAGLFSIGATSAGATTAYLWNRNTIIGQAPGQPDDLDAAIQVPFQRPDVFPAKRNPAFNPKIDLTPRHLAARHNNFYEFIPGKAGPVFRHTDAFKVNPWTLTIDGQCNRPRTFDLDDLFKFEHEERVYHFRCVETWAMNVPWSGFPLSKLLDAVEPTSDAKWVRFYTANEPDQMPGVREAHWYPWPYFEALRMDEARHDLTMAVTGIYGEPLLKQHGSPIRIICPWKYGYKSPKSIVRIELVSDQPPTFWNKVTPGEYGFYSNVNPNSPHPRWSQAREYLLDDPTEKIDTKIFNGYAKFVGDMYPEEPRKPIEKALDPPL